MTRPRRSLSGRKKEMSLKVSSSDTVKSVKKKGELLFVDGVDY